MNNSETKQTLKKAGPPVIIYKTRQDYYDKVPVTLSENRDKIVQYPSQKDIVYGEDFSYPTRLVHGFLLDIRGITVNAAFLDLTYDDYSRLQESIHADFLFSKVLDADPIIEMYHCGSRYEYHDLLTELNELIEQNQFEKCLKLK